MHQQTQSTLKTGDATPHAQSPRLLGELPWLGGAACSLAPTTEQQGEVPLFDFSPHSLVATPDRHVVDDRPAESAAHNTSQHGGRLWRVDTPAAPASPLESSLAAENHGRDTQVAAAAVATVAATADAAPAEIETQPTIDTAPATAATSTPGIGSAVATGQHHEDLAPGWVEIALALHLALAPYARILLMAAMIAIAALLFLVMRDAQVEPEFTPPHDFVPLAEAQAMPEFGPIDPPLFDGSYSEYAPKLNDDEILPDPHRRAPLTVATIAGPGAIARRDKPQPEPQATATSMEINSFAATAAPAPTSEVVPPAYPSTGVAAAPEFGAAQAPVARFTQQIFPITEQAQHEDHQSSIR
jgi:hypothetical protein